MMIFLYSVKVSDTDLSSLLVLDPPNDQYLDHLRQERMSRFPFALEAPILIVI